MKFSKLVGKVIFGLALTATVPAFATDGTNSGGGGVGFYCNVNGQMKAYLADTIQAMRTGQLARMKAYGAADFDQAIEVINQRYPQKVFQHPYVRGQKVTLGFMLSHSNNGLKKIYTDKPIPPTNDDHIPASAVPQNCKKIQLARQDFATKIVMYRSVRLSPQENFYLDLHEAFISLRNRPGINTTEIRQKVAGLSEILSNPNNFALDVLKELGNRWSNREIVAQDKQTRYRTLYYFPRQLMCETTWIGPRSEFRNVKMNVPTKIYLNRTSGDGRVGEHNKYTITAATPIAGVLSRNLQLSNSAARFSTESYNAFGDADGVGTFGFSMDELIFRPSMLNQDIKVEMQLGISDYDSATGEYTGSFELNDADSIRVVEEHSGYGLRCWPSETPIFRHDERSEVYAPSCLLGRTPGCKE